MNKCFPFGAMVFAKACGCVLAGALCAAIAFVRRLGDKAVFVAANLAPRDVAFKAATGATPVVPVDGRDARSPRVLLAERGELSADSGVRLGAYGFVVVEL